MINKVLLLSFLALFAGFVLTASHVGAQEPWSSRDTDLLGNERVYTLINGMPEVEVESEVVPQSVISAQANVLMYVAITGSDSGDCQSPVSPCRTIGYALNQAISSGTGREIRIGIGQYHERGYAVYGGAKVISGGWIPGATWQQVFSLDSANRTIVDGDLGGKLFTFSAGTVADNMTLREGSGNGNVALLLSNGATGRHLIIEDNQATSVGAIEMYGPNNVLESSIIRNNQGGIIDAALSTSRCKPCTISNITFYGNSGSAILQFAGSGQDGEGLIVNNLLAKNQAHALWVAGASSPYPTVNHVLLDSAVLYNPEGVAPYTNVVLMSFQPFGTLAELLMGPAVRKGTRLGAVTSFQGVVWADSNRPDIGAVGYYGNYVETYIPLIRK